MNHSRDNILIKLKLAAIFFIVALISFNDCQSQNIGINNDGTAPSKSALLDIKSSNKGVLVPRIFLTSDTDATTIANPAHALFIYNTNESVSVGKTFYYNENDSVNPHWVPFFQKYDAWHTIGNTGTTPGTNFLGTTDEKDFIIKTFGSERMKFDKNGGLSDHTLSITSLAETFDGVNINTNSITSGSGLKISANSLTNGSGLSIFSNSTAGLNEDWSYGLRVVKSGNNVNPLHASIGIYSAVSNSGDDAINSGGSFQVSGAHWANGVEILTKGVADNNQQAIVGADIQTLAYNNTNANSVTRAIQINTIGNNQGFTEGVLMSVSGSKVMNGLFFSVSNDTIISGYGVRSGIGGYAPANSNVIAAGEFVNNVTSTTANGRWKYGIRVMSTEEYSGWNVGGWFSAHGAPEGQNFAIIVPHKSDSSKWGGWVGIGTIYPKRLLHVDGTIRGGGDHYDGRIEFQEKGGGYVSLNVGELYLGHNINLTLPITMGNAGDFLQLTPITADSATLSWASPTSGWALTGNSGTNPPADFLGTTDPYDLVIKTNNSERMRIKSGGNVGIGTTAPNSLLHVAGVAQVGTANNLEGKISFYNTGGYNAITLKAPTGATATEYTLPSADGTAAQVLTTDGSGGLSWASPAGASGWSLTGNSGTTPGTNFIGTTDANDFVVKTNGQEQIRVLSTGKTGIGISPTALLHLGAGTATANTAPLKFSAGTNMTTPENGAVEYDGTNYFVTSNGTRYYLTKTLTAISSLDFPSTSKQTASDLTITVNGALNGDAVILGIPNEAICAGACGFYAWVSAANTVTVRCWNATSGGINPAAGTFRVSVVKY